jgi:Na+/phosphate symporter
VSSRSLLALAVPLLILLGLLGLLLRQGSDRLQAIPALAIGIGLLLQSLWAWRRRRRALLTALRQRD